MNKSLYFIDCLTNLHVGSGEENYSIVDKQVERDPVTGYPIIHASGIKGALRKAYKGDQGKHIFGVAAEKEQTDDSTGAYRFFNAQLLYRPLRAWGDRPSMNVTTTAMVNAYIKMAESFGIDTGLPAMPELDFKANEPFLATKTGLRVEAEETGLLDDSFNKYKGILGNEFAIAKSLDDYDLPVIARNNLGENRNLWYEEYVPQGSCFYMMILTPDGEDASAVIPQSGIVQIGGNASVGYGYCKFTKVSDGTKGGKER